MIRLDRQRLATATFPDRFEIATRIGDIDVQGHVNNVAVAAILQEARGRFNMSRLGRHLDGRGLVVGSILIEYAGEMVFPEPVAVAVGVLEIGRSSFVLGQIARQSGATTVYAEMTMIVTAAGRSTPLPEAMQSALAEAMIVRG